MSGSFRLEQAAAVLALLLVSAIPGLAAQPFWIQQNGVATETVFLRQAPGLHLERNLPATDGTASAAWPVLAPGDLIRTRPFLHTGIASMTLFIASGTGNRLELYPGSVLALDNRTLRLDLGRMRLIATSGAPLIADLRRGILELPAGEALIEVDPRGNTKLTLDRGTAWLKLSDRSIRRLSPGKQFDIPRYGTVGKPTEAGRLWGLPPEFWTMPRPAEVRPPIPDEAAFEAAEPASDTGDIASEGEQAASEAVDVTNASPGASDTVPLPASGPSPAPVKPVPPEAAGTPADADEIPVISPDIATPTP
ncbi:MAG TPA: hypothetical protein PLP29_14730 [Candidatus Ozemobacteraceae bacterium]|nr:hypothetical protein [Candidatus Ozemobacteraceae bacterium]